MGPPALSTSRRADVRSYEKFSTQIATDREGFMRVYSAGLSVICPGGVRGRLIAGGRGRRCREPSEAAWNSIRCQRRHSPARRALFAYIEPLAFTLSKARQTLALSSFSLSLLPISDFPSEPFARPVSPGLTPPVHRPLTSPSPHQQASTPMSTSTAAPGYAPNKMAAVDSNDGTAIGHSSGSKNDG